MKHLRSHGALLVAATIIALIPWVAFLDAAPLPPPRHGLERPATLPHPCNNGDVPAWQTSTGTWICEALSIGPTTDGGVSGLLPDGGIETQALVDGGTPLLRVGPVIDLKMLRVNGVNVICVSPFCAGTPALYSGPSSVTVTHSTAATMLVNLTTEGTLDWLRIDTVWPTCANVSISEKVSGGGYLGCDAVTLAQSGCSTTSGTDASMTYALTAGDSTDSAPLTGNARYQALVSGPTTQPWGFRVAVKGTSSKQTVVRVYWAQDPLMASTCSITLPDGSTASDVGIVGGTYYKSTFTYRSVVAGSAVLSCMVTARNGAVSPFIWIGFVTVGII